MIERDLGIDDPATPMERRLDVACALVHALIARPASDRPADQAEVLALFEELALPAAVFDAGHAPRLANEAWRALLGARSGVFPSTHVDEVLRTGARLHLPELALVLDDRVTRGAATLRPIRDGAGATTGAIVLCTLLTGEASTEATRAELLARERAARADAERASRLKDQFLAVVSHELRAPLTTMLLWEKVLRETADVAMRAQALDAIHESALSQSRLVDDLLDVSRGICGKLHVGLRPLDIERVLREALEAIAPAALAKQIALARRGAPIAAEVQGDAARLRQVLDNLLTNAVKFTEPGGRIAVAVGRQDRSIVIDVEDSGRGLAPESLPRLFEPFSQFDESLMCVNGGLGLGLAIAKQLVALHHGELTAASPGPGRGATFTLRLPIAEAGYGASSAGGIARRRTLDRVRVLIIDDDRRVRDALTLLLDRIGAVVDTAESAESARAQIALRVPDALVCDIAMPDEDGNSFIRRLRASGSSEEPIPAIALTAHAMEADVERAIAAGFDLHLAKPIDFERLVESIGELLAAHRRARVHMIAEDERRSS
jgi:signal transduction histidine kinase/ActR/RegA family two-component response regulator